MAFPWSDTRTAAPEQVAPYEESLVAIGHVAPAGSQPHALAQRPGAEPALLRQLDAREAAPPASYRTACRCTTSGWHVAASADCSSTGSKQTCSAQLAALVPSHSIMCGFHSRVRRSLVPHLLDISG